MATVILLKHSKRTIHLDRRETSGLAFEDQMATEFKPPNSALGAVNEIIETFPADVVAHFTAGPKPIMLSIR
jgi:hypothetical protein